jgi:hypothetical protein
MTLFSAIEFLKILGYEAKITDQIKEKGMGHELWKEA